jgi:hypothetical protein
VAQVFTLTNSGTTELGVSSVSVTGGNTADFTVNTSGTLTSIPAGGSTTFSVTFTPNSAGLRRTTLRVLSTDADAGVLDIALSGTGTAAVPTVTAPTSTSITSTSALLGGNVTSDGSATITERGVVLAMMSVNNDPLIDGAGVTKIIGTGTTGVFALNAGGLSNSSSYTFRAYATNSVGTAYTTPASSFTTASPQISIEQPAGTPAGSSVTFATQAVATTSSAKVFTIKNTGTGVLSLSSVSFTGGSTADFILNTGGMITSLSAGTGSTTFSVTFSPTAPGPRSTTLRVVSDDADEATLDITLTGTGSPGLPSVLSPVSASISLTSAVLGGDVAGDGGATITGRGVVLAATFVNGNPLIGGAGVTNITAAGTTGVFSVNASGLSSGTGYSFKAYATNALGTTYSSPVSSFTTTAADAPEISFELPAGTALGNVVAWGDAGSAQTTVPAAALSGVTATAAGAQHTLALKGDGQVVAWGNNDDGQSGVPVGLSGVKAIAAGHAHSVAVKTDGTVTAWGANTDGQCTAPPLLTGVKAVAAGLSHTLALKENGTVAGWGNNDFDQASVPDGLSNVVAIAAGSLHSLALMSDGSVKSWGYDADGQATVPAGLNSVIAIAAGQFHSLALKSNGTVVAWGNNNFAQTTVPGLTGIQAIAAGYSHSVALRSAGTVVGWGDSSFLQTTIPTGLSSVKAIAAGSGHTVALQHSVTYGAQLTGTSALDVSSISVTGGNASNFALNTTGMSTSIPAGGSTTFTLTFTPSATGSRLSTLRVLSNDSDEATYDIALTGTGIAAPSVASPTSTSISLMAATLGGNVLNNGGSAIIERGIVLAPTALNAEPLIGGAGVTKLTTTGTTGIFTLSVTGLTPGTAYSFKAFATNATTTGYSTPASFTTSSSNADLSSLALSTGALSPGFSSDTLTYEADVFKNTSAVAVTATSTNATATLQIRINGGSYTPTTSGAPGSSLELNIGSNSIDIRVTAQDSITVKLYTVTVTRLNARQGWRLTHFGSTANAGHGADNATPQNDGITNLLKFATGLNPGVSAPQPGVLVKKGTTLEFTYSRSTEAMSEVTYQVEWSDTLPNLTWSSTGVTESLLNSTPALQHILATQPAGAGNARWVRLRVTAAP